LSTRTSFLNVIQFIVPHSWAAAIDERSAQLCDARLADGFRVNAVNPAPGFERGRLPHEFFPGPQKKFQRDPFQSKEPSIRFRSCNEAGFGFLKARRPLAKANIVVSGVTGTGKTTFLNVLSGFIPVWDRIVTIEERVPGCKLQPGARCPPSRPRPKDINGEGEITSSGLSHALRMRPERKSSSASAAAERPLERC